MPEWVQLQAADGHMLEAYVARPASAPRAGLLVLQEIFGVNAHIQAVTEDWAQRGYLSIAPALFDRVAPRIELSYGPDGMQRGRETRSQIPLDQTIADMEAAIEWLRTQDVRKVFAVGYCWGGSLAWFANTRLGVDASSSYYGGMIADAAQEQNRSPAIFHFGSKDKHIGPDHWERIRAAHPDLPLYVYDADHAFNRRGYPPYDAVAAEQALERTLALFHSAE